MFPKELSIPTALLYRAKYYLWVVITPFHNPVRDILAFFGFINHVGMIDGKGRQRFLLGKLSSDRTPEDFFSYLATRGFEHHFPAWVDPEEEFGMRFRESFVFQYHIRLYKDGEIRGHYEYTPEAHPFAHLKEMDIEARRHKFMEFLENWIETEEEDVPNIVIRETIVVER
ncbi:MAG: hypothetical protein KGZ30_03180 [Anaplasmataceae bacterium]|nr:hypothetical protein [Anaplasmataceae bacterium]